MSTPLCARCESSLMDGDKLNYHVPTNGPQVGQPICHPCYRQEMLDLLGIDVDRDLKVNVFCGVRR